MEEKTISENIIKGRTYGAFRCLNCFVRIVPHQGAKIHKCPHCGYEWRLSWINPTTPRIRGPVWDVNRRLAQEQVNAEQRAKSV